MAEEQMQIKYLTELTEPATVYFNFEELKKLISENLEKYKNLVVTEETILENKKIVAKLNKFFKTIDDERKRYKNIFLTPYSKIEAQFYELSELVHKTSMAINNQIETFRIAELEKKQEQIQEIFSKYVGNLEKYIELENIYQKYWDNKTVSLKKIEAEIKEKIEKINCDIEVIKNFKSEFETELISTYFKWFDLGEVVREKETLEEFKKFSEEQKKEKSEIPTISENETVEEKIYTRKFYVKATKEQLVKLSEFLKLNNIVFGQVD